MVWVMEYLCYKWSWICSTCHIHFPVLSSWLITVFVSRLTPRVVLVEQELPTLPEHLSSPPVFSGVHVTQSLVLCVCFVDCCLSLCLLAILLSVLLRYTDSDYPFSIFKLVQEEALVDLLLSYHAVPCLALYSSIYWWEQVALHVILMSAFY